MDLITIKTLNNLWSDISECKMTLSHTHGVITSPGFPQNYLDGTNCTWLIRLPLGQQIEIIFLHFDLESYNNPDYC